MSIRTRLRNFLPKQGGRTDLSEKSTVELLALMRHESHRIEKAVYNDLLEKKHDDYRERQDRVLRIHSILTERGVRDDEPTWVWSREIVSAFDNLEKDYVVPRATEPLPFDAARSEELLELFRSRRSVRVWNEEQPDLDTLTAAARLMIEGARWAPNSGNRQPWRFRIITEQAEKEELRVLKEEHTRRAPLLIFVGMDTRVYGALGKTERSIYIDAGAAIMQMVLVGHACGLGVCWNHFADDLIGSRPANTAQFKKFAATIQLPEFVAPVAIVAIGWPAFLPPDVARTDIDDLLF